MVIKKFQLLWLLLVILVAGCSSPSPPTPLKIGVYQNWPTSGTVFVAQEKGLFAKYGVQATIVLSEYTDSIKLYKEGKVDIVFMVLTDAVMFESEGVSSHFIYVTEYSDSADVIIGRSTLNGLSDLKGKKVSFEGFNSSSHFMVLKLLEDVGLKEGDFQAANIENTKVIAALEAGEIDAGHVYGMPISEAIEKGYKAIEKAGKVPYSIMIGWVVSADAIKARSKEVQAVVNALAEATDLLIQSPEESLPIMAKQMPISQEELKTIYQGLHIFSLQENQEVFKSNGLLAKGGKEIVDFFYQKGVLVKLPDLNKMIDGQFVAAVRKQP